MARKARQGTRPRKKQARRQSSTPAVIPEHTEPVPVPEPAKAQGTLPSRPSGVTTRAVPSGSGSPRVTITRSAKPYQPRRGRPIAMVRSASAASAYVLPREREYDFIRSDLRRLLMTAAALAIVMVALLVILEP